MSKPHIRIGTIGRPNINLMGLASVALLSASHTAHRSEMIRKTAILRRDASKSNSDWKCDVDDLTAADVIAYFELNNVPLTDEDKTAIDKGHAIQKQVGDIHYRTVFDRYDRP